MKLKTFLPSIVWAIVIFLLCHLPGKDIPDVPIAGIDKIVHISLFFILTLLVLKAYSKEHKEKKHKITLWLFIIVLYGISLELYQGFCVEGRKADIYDVIANGIGVLVAFMLLKYRNKIRNI